MQSVVHTAVQPIAITVLVAGEINLSPAGFLAVHGDIVRNSFIEPGRTAIQGIVVPNADRAVIHSGIFPAGAFNIMRGFQSGVEEVIGLGHRFADKGRFRSSPLS